MTYKETVGAVLFGTHFTHCKHDTTHENGKLVLVPSPLKFGRGGPVQWDEKQSAPGGWERKITHSTDTSNVDPTRTHAKYIVLQITMEPVSTGRDSGYGGGPRIHVKRLAPDGSFDPNGEEIVYTRGCYNADLNEDVEILEVLMDLIDPIVRHNLLARLTPDEKRSLGITA